MLLKITYFILNFKKYSTNTYNNGLNGACQFSALGAGAVGAKVASYSYVNPTEADLLNAVSTIGPISIAYMVNDNFYSYSSGINRL